MKNVECPINPNCQRMDANGKCDLSRCPELSGVRRSESSHPSNIPSPESRKPVGVSLRGKSVRAIPIEET